MLHCIPLVLMVVTLVALLQIRLLNLICQMRKKQHEVKKNELERYLEDGIEDTNPNDVFDILKWWKGKLVKYYILSDMARDILVVPMSIVSYESAFSTGGRVLDPFRSSLRPSTVEALICAQNWLRTAPKVIEL